MATHASLEIRDRIAYLSFAEEEERKPCTLDWDVLHQMDGFIDQIEADIQNIGAVVVQSESPKSFVVGANIAVLETLDAVSIMEWVRLGHRVFKRFSKLPVAVIAKVKHAALGGGLELAMSCDFIIAGENAKFGQPEAGLGVMPGWGGSYRLPTLVGPARAKEMFFSASPLTAKEAYDWGIVNRVCTEDTIDQAVEEFCHKVMANDCQVTAFVKEYINNRFYSGIDDDTAFEAISSGVCMNSESTKARMAAFFASRKKK